MNETKMKDDECESKKSTASETSIKAVIHELVSNLETVKKRKANRNSKPSKKQKANRNSKPSKKQKANRNSKPSKKQKTTGNSKACARAKNNRNSKPSQKQKANRNSKPSMMAKRNRNSKPSRQNRKKTKQELNYYTGRKEKSHEDNLPELENLYCMNIKPEIEEHLDNVDIYNAINEKYFSSILQPWLRCCCCGALHAESQLQTAAVKHELEHDVVEGELLCKKCIRFTPSQDRPHCLFARNKNWLEISAVPDELKLGFMEQRAVTLSHVYMSIILVRGHQAALKGQVVHFHVDSQAVVDQLLPFPRCHEFLAVVQEKPAKNQEITTTVTYSFSAVQVLKALIYLKQHNHLYFEKEIMTVDQMQLLFKCQSENISPIKIIDSYAYNNSTTTAPFINSSDVLCGPKRIISCAKDAIWQVEPFLEERAYPWLYPYGKGGEADPERPLTINLRDYYKLRLKSADNRWQADPTWIFRALNILQRDDLHIGAVIRGSSAFWNKARRHLRAMYATLGKPFIFLSINLQNDTEFLTHIDSEKFGSAKNPKWDAINNLSSDEYLLLANQNAALVARMCKRRIAAFEEYIKDKKYPFLIDYVVSHYFMKVEFQRDGLPHVHTLIWVENAPSTETSEGRAAIIKFIDRLLTTELPDINADPVLFYLVRMFQWHIHTFSCNKDHPFVKIRRAKKQLKNAKENKAEEETSTSCNFNREHEDEIYEKVNPDEDIDMFQAKLDRKEFFERAGCRYGKPEPLASQTHFRTYKEAKILTRGDRDIIIKRISEESRRIVPYNVNLLKTFKCNHDIQIVTDPWAAAEYLFSYVSKEAHMEKDLVQKLAGCTCSTIEEAKKILLKAGNAVLSHRQIGKIEAAWIVLGIPLYRCSMATVHIYLSLPCDEDRLLKNKNISAESLTENDFVKTIVDRYSERPSQPDIINDITLFEFATWFSIEYGALDNEDGDNQELKSNPLWQTDYNEGPLMRTSKRLPRIVLSSGHVMRQHQYPKCVTFTCLHDNTAQSIYSILCLNVPHRNSIIEFLCGKQEPSTLDLYQALVRHQSEICRRITTLPESYRIQLQNLVLHLISINNENFMINYRESYIFTNPNEFEAEDDNNPISEIKHPDNIASLSINDEIDRVENGDRFKFEEFRKLKQLRDSTNCQQKYLLEFIQNYFDYVLKHVRRPHEVIQPKPFHIVVNGLAGSGKSYVIDIIEKMMKEYCIAESSGISRARKNYGLLKMAHTGKAALNIRGSTIHSALAICPDNNSSPKNLNSFKLYTLRNRLSGLLLIIIDEISLVSHCLFQKINKRLNEIFLTAGESDVYFGGIPIIVFGDMAQIEPVAAKQVFFRPRGELFSLWHDLFRPVNFDINMRQGNDRLFFDCLCRMRTGCLDEEIEALIKSRSIRKEDNPDSYEARLKDLQSVEFKDAIYAYGTRRLTNSRNLEMLKEHCRQTKHPIFMINALDKVAMIDNSFYKASFASNKTCKVKLKPSNDENKCGSLYPRFPLCVGARVLIRRNIDQENYIVNGTDAIVKEIVWEDPRNFLSSPIAVDDTFNSLNNVINTKLPKYVVVELDNGLEYKIEPQETRFKDMNNVNMTRLQLPFALGYAITIHRTQCMTYPKMVVDLGGKYWKAGMFYTVLSRARRITDILLLAYDRQSFKVSRDGLQEIERLQKIENENPVKLDDYLRYKTDDSALNSAVSSDMNCIEEKNQKRKYDVNNEIEENKRCKTASNVVRILNDIDVTKDLIPEHFIICEKQQRLFCGRHALRAIVQNTTFFDDEFLQSLGRQLASDELMIREDISAIDNEYFNVYSGYYNIQVVQEALRRQCNIELIQWNRVNKMSSSVYQQIMNNIEFAQGLFIHQTDHYFCLRRFDSTPHYFFIIDSLKSSHHQTIKQEQIREYINYLHQHNSSIYIPISGDILYMEIVSSE
ncbi:unnamed protein product, partial [Adineta ricciae]